MLRQAFRKGGNGLPADGADSKMGDRFTKGRIHIEVPEAVAHHRALVFVIEHIATRLRHGGQFFNTLLSQHDQDVRLSNIFLGIMARLFSHPSAPFQHLPSVALGSWKCNYEDI